MLYWHTTYVPSPAKPPNRQMSLEFNRWNQHLVNHFLFLKQDYFIITFPKIEFYPEIDNVFKICNMTPSSLHFAQPSCNFSCQHMWCDAQLSTATIHSRSSFLSFFCWCRQFIIIRICVRTGWHQKRGPKNVKNERGVAVTPSYSFGQYDTTRPLHFILAWSIETSNQRNTFFSYRFRSRSYRR